MPYAAGCDPVRTYWVSRRYTSRQIPTAAPVIAVEFESVAKRTAVLKYFSSGGGEDALRVKGFAPWAVKPYRAHDQVARAIAVELEPLKAQLQRCPVLGVLVDWLLTAWRPGPADGEAFTDEEVLLLGLQHYLNLNGL